MKTKPKVAFICVHNSCRSQIAEALGRHFASDIFESYSAGTEKTWGLDDPTGNTDEVFIKVIKTIEQKIFKLMEQLKDQPYGDPV